MAGIIFTGISGRNYSYLIFDHTNERNMLQGGANYAFAANDRLPIFFEATDNLKQSFLIQNKSLWEEARDVHSAKHLLSTPAAGRGWFDCSQAKGSLVGRDRPSMKSSGSEWRYVSARHGL